MKLLFLSVCGLLNEPEETKYINLYLASLKKHVVPHFNLKVILLTTYKIQDLNSSLLQQRIIEYELENVVELKTLESLELPEKSLEIIQSVDWFNRIGIHMNILYDYSKKYNFFDADWLFHVDTDCEFLENFEKCINKIHALKDIHDRIVITLSGDSYPMHLVYENTEYIFEQPKRINFYDELNVEKQSVNVLVAQKTLREDDHRRKYKVPVFSPYQMKVRNDFVGISKEMFSEADKFNWVCMHYSYNFKDNNLIEKFWPDKAFKETEDGNIYEVGVPQIHINFHMGGMLQYVLHSGELNITRVNLPSYSHAVLHYSSGWFNGTFLTKSQESLNSKYQDTKYIWGKDYE